LPVVTASTELIVPAPAGGDVADGVHATGAGDTKVLIDPDVALGRVEEVGGAGACGPHEHRGSDQGAVVDDDTGVVPGVDLDAQPDIDPAPGYLVLRVGMEADA
jgi:hypothetical protein